MLSPVLDLLSARRWFDTGLPFETSVHLTQGACVWLLLSRAGVGDTHVKFSEHISLRDEAARCEAASRCYPSLVPPFVGRAVVDGLDVLVCRSVDFRAVDAAFLLKPATRPPVRLGLLAYFSAMPSAAAAAALGDLAAVSNTALFKALGDYSAGQWLAPLAQRWLGAHAGLLARLPALAQHGDFVLNNLGRTKRGDLVIFDWEDFGSVCLPGLDLFTLELSLAGGADLFLAARARQSVGLRGLLAQACAAVGLDLADYWALTPIYALVFRYLKRNYGPDVRQQMDRLLLQLDAAPDACPTPP